jgi:hypothetical protein
MSSAVVFTSATLKTTTTTTSASDERNENRDKGLSEGQ